MQRKRCAAIACGGNIIHHIAILDDLELAMAAYEAACKQWPGEAITLRQGARIIKADRRNALRGKAPSIEHPVGTVPARITRLRPFAGAEAGPF